MKRFLCILACFTLFFSLSAGLVMAAEGDKDTTKKEETIKKDDAAKKDDATKKDDAAKPGASTQGKPKGNDLDS